MEKLKQKLSSRKLWAAIVGVIVGIAAAFGIEENEWVQIAGIVTSAASVCAYIFGESSVDSARERYGIDVDGLLKDIEEIEKKAEENLPEES